MIRKVLIIGATGFIGREVHRLMLAESNHQLTLFSRHANQVKVTNSKREQVLVGDILNQAELTGAIKGQDVVVWAATGDIETLTRPVIDAMVAYDVVRLLHMNPMGIYNEVPAKVGTQFNLDNWPAICSSRKGADIVTASPLNYTIVRGDRHYTLLEVGEPFGGRTISRMSIADFMLKLTNDPPLYSRTSVGIHRPL